MNLKKLKVFCKKMYLSLLAPINIANSTAYSDLGSNPRSLIIAVSIFNTVSQKVSTNSHIFINLYLNK